MRKHTSTFAAVLAFGVAAAALVGCSAPADESDGTITLVVGDRPSADRPEDRKYFDERIAAFEDANPGITIDASEAVWDAATFQALVAGGTQPDVMSVPFTEPQGLIARGQAADITAALEAEGLLDVLNPELLALASDASGNVFAVPTSGYSFGLVYNRAIFEQAGLDPDAPPTTWTELREVAQTITEATGVPGFGQMASSNTGGWSFTGETYSWGGSVENADGSEATFDDEPARQMLQLLHDMRFVDGTLPENALYDQGAIHQDFAAGRIGMILGAPDAYWNVVRNLAFPAEDFGVGGMPQGDGGPHGTLSGGTAQIVNPNTTEAERAAAIKWIEFLYLERFVNEEVAVADARASSEADSVTGLPGLPVVSQESYERYFEWIADYINVPTENFAPYLQAAQEVPIIAEPVSNAQEVYATLDSLIQAVLTDPNADIDALLAQAAQQVQSRLG